MHIGWKNRKLLDEFRIHDSEFGGLNYDYDKRIIEIICSNYCLEKMFNITFNNVILFEVQSCCFWSEGNNIRGMYIEECSHNLKELKKIQNDNKEDYQGSYLNRGFTYMEVTIELNSGDEIHIICQSVDCIENEMDRKTKLTLEEKFWEVRNNRKNSHV